ncbi:4614_t:CDS:2, partial [Entrophospora sp. SA101]
LTHDHWVEQEDDRKQVASDITDVLLQKLKSNVLHRVTYGSESAFVEIMAQLIEASLYKLPIEYDVEVTRSERQSMANGKYFNIEICKEDKVATLKKGIEGLLVNQGHQELSINFNLYTIIPMESTAEVSKYFNATPVTNLNQVNLLIKPKE